MSIKHCDIHGYWETDYWGYPTHCRKCLLDMAVEREERGFHYTGSRKTFLGMTSVGWFLFSYIAIVMIAMALIVIAHVPEAQ